MCHFGSCFYIFLRLGGHDCGPSVTLGWKMRTTRMAIVTIATKGWLGIAKCHTDSVVESLRGGLVVAILPQHIS